MKINYLLIFINVAIFIIANSLNVHDETIFMGANNNYFVLIQGQYYRLFTAIFLHTNYIHLLINMFSLFQVGSFLEDGLGKFKFLILYLLSGLGGSLFSMLFQKEVLSVGASGAIFGLIGALLAWSVIKNQWSITKIVILNLALNIIITLTVPNIDNFGHFGGFFTGFSLGLLLFLTGPNIVLVDNKN
jgi:rhomboid protease GluP